MTQLEAARKGLITAEMWRVAQRECVTSEFVRDEVARGRLVIPANRRHLAGSGGAAPALPARCRLLAGMTSRPRATSSRMNSGRAHSRCATRRISPVIRPFRAASSCVISRFPPPALPGSGSRGQQARPAFSAASSGAAPPASCPRASDHTPRGRQVK